MSAAGHPELPSGPLNRSAIFLFCLAFAGTASVLDITDVVGLSPYSVKIKYGYTAVILALMYHYFSRFAHVCPRSPGPPLALAFFVAAGTGFVLNAAKGIEVSYVTSFTAPLAFATAFFIPAERMPVNTAAACRSLRALFLLGSACYLIEASLKASGTATSFSYAPEIEHVKSIVCVLGLALACLTGARRDMALLLAITIASLAVRPSSTLLVAVVACVPLAYAFRHGLRRVASWCVWGSLALAAATPWLFYFFFNTVASIATSGEGYVKEDLLYGHSNTDFRLEIMRLALRKLDGSLLFGQAMSGNPNVDLGSQWPWWHQIVPDGTALIHSDWLVVVTQGGLVGAALFALMFAAILRLRLRALRALSSATSPSEHALVSLSAVACVAFFLYSTFNPVMPLYHIVHVFWFVLLVSEMTAKKVLLSKAATAPLDAVAQPA